MNDKRIAWIDYAKGIGIFLVVCGHTGIPSSISNFIWSFHMPLFFCISGILFDESKYNNLQIFLTSKLRALLIPYFLFSVIVYFLYTINGEEQNFIQLIIHGWNGSALWFIPILFFTELLFFYLIKLRINKNMLTVIVICIYFIGFLISNQYAIKLPYKLQIITIAILFYSSGYFLKDIFSILSINLIIIISIFILLFVLSQLLPRFDMAATIYGNALLNPLAALIGIGGIISLSIYLTQQNKAYINYFFLWAGTNSLTILALHQPINILLKNSITLPFQYTINSLSRHVILWTILFLLSKLFIKYAPLLIGKKCYKLPLK